MGRPYATLGDSAPPRAGRSLRFWVTCAVAAAVTIAVATALSDRGRNAAAATHVGPLVRMEGEDLRAQALAGPEADATEAAAVLPVPSEPAVPAPAPADEPLADAVAGLDARAAAPAPAPLAAAEAVEDAVAAAAPKQQVAFLFLTINGEVVFPEVWAEFFRAADPEAFAVYIHRSNGDTAEVSPAAHAFLLACRGRAEFVATAPGTEWGQLIAAERSLAAAALEAPLAAAFAYVSHTTLPVKSFRTVYDTLLRGSDGAGGGVSSSFCLNGQDSWVRSRAAPDTVFPKHAQWMVLSRPAAARFANASAGDAVAAVNAACGGSWRQCYPSTSEELVMAAITGGVPAVAMGSDWLASHPPPDGGADNELVTALRLEIEADIDDGRPAADVVPLAFDVNAGGVRVRDSGAQNEGACLTWHWWDDYRNDVEVQPAFEPFQLLLDAQPTVAEGARGAEDVIEAHVDRFWSPPYHPQELRGGAMTEAFLLTGLCRSKALFARKFAPDFSLRPAPLARAPDGDWACPAAVDGSGGEDVWHAAARGRLDGVSCDGMRHAPMAGVGQHECRSLCCAMGREQCTAWQYRGRFSARHFCWVGHATRCSEYGEAQAQLWRGEQLLDAPPPPPDARERERAAVLAAFARCFADDDADAATEQQTPQESAGAPAPAPGGDGDALVAETAAAMEAALSAEQLTDDSAADDAPADIEDDAAAAEPVDSGLLPDAGAADSEAAARLSELNAAAQAEGSTDAPRFCAPGDLGCLRTPRGAMGADFDGRR